MKKKYKIIVAHPDDEVIFFSSILKKSSQTIISFTYTQDLTVNIGRKHLKKKSPFKNYLFLDLIESDVFNTGNWNNPKKFNESLNNKSFLDLKNKLAKVINYGDTIYTHNPWGEYGHEGHVQVFRAVKSLQNKFKLTIFVNGYVSNKSYQLMVLQKNLLSSDIVYKKINEELSEKLKNIYISSFCWTWNDNFKWPKNEIFFRINKIKETSNKNKITSTLPMIFLMGNYKINSLRSYITRKISYKNRIRIKKFLNKIY